jgi:hypothetical protein
VRWGGGGGGVGGGAGVRQERNAWLWLRVGVEASAPRLSGRREAVEHPPRPTTSANVRGETSMNRRPADDERKIELIGGG